MKTLCVIPARLGSTRLPRKPLQLLAGKTIIEHTLAKALACTAIDQVVVATDSEEVVNVVEAANGRAVMTDSTIKTGTDRVAASAAEFPDFDVIINLQGDEPFMQPNMLATLIEPFVNDETVQMSTLASSFPDESGYNSPDQVKVICDQKGDAIYFSRSPLPYFRNDQDLSCVLHHMGVYAFRPDFLQTYSRLPQTPLEQAELLEQLRALEHGYKIRVCHVDGNTLEINTPEELALAREKMEGDMS